MTSLSAVLPRTGVCLDAPHLRGVSRLMGRMLFMGAGGLSNRELNGRLERLGATMGCGLGNDNIFLRLDALTENLDAALELFLLSVHQPNFDEAEFASLKGELVSSWVADREEHKQLRAQEMYMQQIYRDAPNGFLPDGTGQGLRASTLDDVRAQHVKLFGGGEPFLAVLSDLPEGEIRARIADKVELPRRANGSDYPWDGFVLQFPFNNIRNSSNSTIHQHLQQGPIIMKNRSEILRNSKNHMTMFHIKSLPSNTIRPFITKSLPTMSTHPRITTKMNNLHFTTNIFLTFLSLSQ